MQEDTTVELTSGGKTVKMTSKEFDKAARGQASPVTQAKVDGMVENILKDIEPRHCGDVNRLLECHLTEAELLVRGDELAKANIALAEAEKLESERRKEAKDKLSAMSDKVNELAKTVKEKKEVRGVFVVFDLVSTAQGEMVREIRTDTGEMLNLRPPTAHERQPGLGLT